MKTPDEMFTLPTDAFLSAFHDDSTSFDERFAIWDALQKRLLQNLDDPYYHLYFIPLLSPYINEFKYRLPAYGTYREDFEQEVYTDLCIHIKDYQPGYGGNRMLGSVYFRNRIKGVFTNFVRGIKKDLQTEELLIRFEDGTEEECLPSDQQDDMLDLIIRERILKEYHDFREQYSEYYAREKTKKSAKEHGWV